MSAPEIRPRYDELIKQFKAILTQVDFKRLDSEFIMELVGMMNRCTESVLALNLLLEGVAENPTEAGVRLIMDGLDQLESRVHNFSVAIQSRLELN